MFKHPNRIEPGPGQESVWDYPRPPRVEDSSKHIKVVFNGEVIARFPPVTAGFWKPAILLYYIPQGYVQVW